MNTGQTTDPSSQQVPAPAPSQQPESSPQTESSQAETQQSTAEPQQPAVANPPAAGPLASVARGKGPLAARGASVKPASPAAKPLSPAAQPAGQERAQGGGPAPAPRKDRPQKPLPKLAPTTNKGDADESDAVRQPVAPPPRPAKAAVPNLRQPLPSDIQAELERELAAASELDAFLGGSAGMAARREPLQEGQRVHATVLKIHDDSVFVALGGPDEGVVPFEQFTGAEPEIGSSIEVVVRGINSADGLYQLTLPGEAVDVSDWSDIEPGSLVEATVTGANSGGLECKVAGISGFIPISQISEHRVEDTSEFVDQKFICVVTEANPRRGNLVLSRRAVLEREREERRQEQLEKIQPGDLLEGTVRTVKDFGAFVDLGGLEGLIHVSKLSWERIKHPSEVIEPGQKVKVKVEKIDKQTGKISLSYRDLLENPWDTVVETIAPGAVLKGTVTRTTAFGAFVKLAPGVEGLVHISEIAGHRVSNVAAFLKEGQEVDVKVLSVDRDTQKISLSIKQAIHKPAEETTAEVEEESEPLQPVVKPTHQGPLRGGNDQVSGGERFGLKW